MRAVNILETIGNTPHVQVHRLFDPRVHVWMKLERANPGGSIKDRMARNMIVAALKSGRLKPGGEEGYRRLRFLPSRSESTDDSTVKCSASPT